MGQRRSHDTSRPCFGPQPQRMRPPRPRTRLCTPMSKPPREAILRTGLAFWPANTLLSAIEPGVFTELARGPETLDVLMGRLGLHPRSARDFFDTIVALGFLTRAHGRYANTVETEGRRPADGSDPPRLGPVREAHADRQGVRGAADWRRAGRLRVDHRQRPIEERVRPDDEPQHAHRDAGRLRLHGRRLRGLDEGRRLHVGAHRAPGRARLDGRGHQMGRRGRRGGRTWLQCACWWEPGRARSS
jgi:hypothetical protein